jgi:hypothetical protein
VCHAVARLWLESGEYERAAKVIMPAHKNHPGNAKLKDLAIEVSATQGGTEQIDKILKELRQDRVYDERLNRVARGLVRLGNLQDAARAVVTALSSHAIAHSYVWKLFFDPIACRLWDDGILEWPTAESLILGIAQTHLSESPPRSFVGYLPSDKLANAIQSGLLVDVSREQIVFFHDWSWLGDGKTGFAITTKSVRWRCTWQEPICVSLTEVTRDGVQINGTTLTVAGHQIDMDALPLATETYNALREVPLALEIARL